MESKLLYTATQQMNPWRAGTPGRAPRNWRAVVIEWRPLRLFILLFGLLAGTRSAAGQSLQLRVGALYATPLVKDAVSTKAVNDSIPGERSTSIELQQKLAPIATLALHLPMRGKSEIEISTSVARSMLSGDDGLETWDVFSVTMANLVTTIGYHFSRALTWHAGVGATKLFIKQSGMFTAGNAIKPLVEVGLSLDQQVASRALQIDARMETHSFATSTFRDNNGSDGSVIRGILQVGTSIWQKGRP